MKYLLYRVGLAIVLCLWLASGYSQKLTYQVSRNGKKIGEMTVEPKDSAGLKGYLLKGKTLVDLVFITKTTDLTVMDWFDKDGKLVSAYYHNIKDDGILHTETVSKKHKLLIERNGEKSEIDGPVTYTSAMLYFAEPTNIKQMYSERLGRLLGLKSMGDGVYEASVDGGTGTFTYKNNLLIQLSLNKGMVGTIVMSLVN